MQKVWKCVVENMPVALQTLHRLEGRLALIGANKAASELVKYRNALTDLQSAAHIKGGDFYTPPTLDTWNAMARLVHEHRNRFFEILRREYERK